ncbi:MAG TPA: hypothetical protein VK666_08615 [Chryseolinea sp.]|nr:hypothetical protein [Chryseolinea sp.]
MTNENRDAAVDKRQCVEFGLLSILVTLISASISHNTSIVTVGIVLVLITMLLPVAFYPFAFVWFKLVRLMSILGPWILLSIVFYLVVTPMGALRKLQGKNSMRRREFKRSTESVMQTRDHLYNKEDFLHMF